MEVRADVYLCAIRMYKSRSLATTAIKCGKVKINDKPIKSSYSVKIGERITLMIGHTKKILEITALTETRSSFDIAKTHYIDHSPPPEKKDYMPSAFFSVNIKRERGTGRPTKKIEEISMNLVPINICTCGNCRLGKNVE